jgi:hypothetical protein
MTCSACTKAATTPEWGEFTADCRGCCARAAARSPQFFESRKNGTQTRAYRALLEQFGLTHDEVRAAHAADAHAKEAA